MEEKNRFRELNKAYSNKGEAFKKKENNVDPDKISEEFKRLKELASGVKTSAKKTLKEFNQHSSYNTNQGKTVNNIFSDPTQNGNQYIGAIGNTVALKDGEAMNLAITRTLESGAPVDGISFYDEVNWNLNNLNFRAKSPQDIKEAILKLIKG